MGGGEQGKTGPEPVSENQQGDPSAPRHSRLAGQSIGDGTVEAVLASIDLLMIAVDDRLCVSMITPALALKFDTLHDVIGRPLVDLTQAAARELLADMPADAVSVQESGNAVEREVCALGGPWYRRRASPYGPPTVGVRGVVIVFSEITAQHLSSEALAAARYDAASAANSRLLASANYDLRQPLQTLALLHGLLEKTVQGTRQLELVARVNDMVVAMTEILNPLLDINQIEAGIAAVDQRDFPITTAWSACKTNFPTLQPRARFPWRPLPAARSFTATRCGWSR